MFRAPKDLQNDLTIWTLSRSQLAIEDFFFSNRFDWYNLISIPCLQVFLVKSGSWLRLHRHSRLRKRLPTMQGYAASWWMLDLRCSGPLLTKYIHQRLYIQFWEVPQCITPHWNHCTKGGTKCWIPRNGESCTLLTHLCLLQPSISHL